MLKRITTLITEPEVYAALQLYVQGTPEETKEPWEYTNDEGVKLICSVSDYKAYDPDTKERECLISMILPEDKYTLWQLHCYIATDD